MSFEAELLCCSHKHSRAGTAIQPLHAKREEGHDRTCNVRDLPGPPPSPPLSNLFISLLSRLSFVRFFGEKGGGGQVAAVPASLALYLGARLFTAAWC